MIRRHADKARSGFTLIEVMVVILIISILVSLTAVVLTKVRTKAKEATAQAEMAQVSNAIGAFKVKLNASFLPAFQPSSSTGGSFRLASGYTDASGALIPAFAPEATYLKQLFPQMNLSDNGLRDSSGKFINNGVFMPAGSTNGPMTLDPNQSMLFFLTGSTFTSFQGFSTNRQTPFASPSGGPSVGPFLDVAAGKLDTASPPHYTDPWGNPYAYLAFDPNLNKYPNATCFGVSPYSDSTGKPLNQKGFQIISAGKDGAFGPGGAWTPQQGQYAIGAAGADDLASFNSTPLGSQD